MIDTMITDKERVWVDCTLVHEEPQVWMRTRVLPNEEPDYLLQVCEYGMPSRKGKIYTEDREDDEA